MLLYCCAAGFNKYAYGLLKTAAQKNALLSPRAAHDLTWNRFVNTKGKPDTNIPIDLHLEHCNRPLKTDNSTFRGEITEKTLHRLSRSVQNSEIILKQYDRNTDMHRPSGKHTNVDKEHDISMLASALTQNKVFDRLNGRSHKQFPQMRANPLSILDVKEL